MKHSTMYIVLGLVAVILVGGFLWGRGTGLFSVGGQMATTDDGEPVLNTCESTTTPDLDINAYDIENVGTADTEATNLYRKVGDIPWNTFTAGTAFTVEFDEQYEIVMGISTTDQTDNSYGQHFITDKVECDELTTINKPVAIDEIETGISATFFNADGDASTAETFTTGQSQTVSLKLLSGTDEYCGNPFIVDSTATNPAGARGQYPNVVCANLNSSEWDPPERVSFDGVEMKRLGTPTRHAAVSSMIAYCYEAPVITQDGMENNRYLMRLNADDTNAPGTDMTAHIYCGNFYVNADDGKIYWGVEDEDGNAAGTDASDTVTLDFT